MPGAALTEGCLDHHGLLPHLMDITVAHHGTGGGKGQIVAALAAQQMVFPGQVGPVQQSVGNHGNGTASGPETGVRRRPVDAVSAAGDENPPGACRQLAQLTGKFQGRFPGSSGAGHTEKWALQQPIISGAEKYGRTGRTPFMDKCLGIGRTDPGHRITGHLQRVLQICLQHRFPVQQVDNPPGHLAAVAQPFQQRFIHRIIGCALPLRRLHAAAQLPKLRHGQGLCSPVAQGAAQQHQSPLRRRHQRYRFRTGGFFTS